MTTTVSTIVFDQATTTISQKLFSAYVNLPSIPYIALPIAIFYYSFSTSQSFYKENGSFHTSIKDLIDEETFKKIILPLFTYINNDLTNTSLASGRVAVGGDFAQYVRDIDADKLSILSTCNFSYLEEAVEFQDAIEKIIKGKRNQIFLKNLIKKCRFSIVSLTYSSGINILLGIALVGIQSILGSGSIFFNLVLSVWIINLIITIVFGVFFYNYKLSIEKMRYE